MSPRLGVCSWSLQPADLDDLLHKLASCRLRCLQLALAPIADGAWTVDTVSRRLAEAGVVAPSGMLAFHAEDYSSIDSIRRTGGVRPDEHWPRNLADARAAARAAADLRIPLVSFHAGFIPEHDEDPLRLTMIQRVAEVAHAFASLGVRTALETGQESAPTLLRVLRQLHPLAPTVSVNFDPANMILYGVGDPIDALRLLAPHVAQIHIKDALPPQAPGQWGTETPVGRGAVDWRAFFSVYRDAPLRCDLIIERESGDSRTADVAAAADLVRSHLPNAQTAP